MIEAFIGSFISAMATVLGAIPLLFVKSLSEKWKDILIAFTAGIMVSASTFGLLPQALNESGLIPLTLGLLIGVIALDLIEKIFPISTLSKKEESAPLTANHCSLFLLYSFITSLRG